MVEESNVYDASIGEFISPECTSEAIDIIPEAVDDTTDFESELNIATAELLTSNSKIASLEETISELNIEITNLKLAIKELQLNDEIKALLVTIRSIDPEINAVFVTDLNVTQLIALKESLIRVSK